MERQNEKLSQKGHELHIIQKEKFRPVKMSTNRSRGSRTESANSSKIVLAAYGAAKSPGKLKRRHYKDSYLNIMGR